MCPHWSCHLYAPVHFSVNKTNRRRIPLLKWKVLFIAAMAAYLLCFILPCLIRSLLGEEVIVRVCVLSLLQEAAAALAMLKAEATASHTGLSRDTSVMGCIHSERERGRTHERNSWPEIPWLV